MSHRRCTAQSGYLEILSEYSFSEAQKLYCNFSSKCMYVYMHMINALLDISPIESYCEVPLVSTATTKEVAEQYPDYYLKRI